MRALVRLLVPFAALAAGAAGVALHSGCSRSSAPPTPTIVRGRVTFQGRPVAGGLVVFTPDRDRGASGKPIRAETGPDGIFQMPTGDSGVSPGWYRVAIAPPPNTDPGAKPPFPPQLRRPDTSTVVREVTPGKEHFFEFAVEVPNG